LLRHFLRSTAGIACLVALAGTVIVWSAARLIPATVAAVDGSLYETWLRTRSPIPVSPAVVYATRNAETDIRFGAGPLDPALLARIISALNRAGAAVIGIAAPLEHPNAQRRGGAAGEAMLIEATRASGRVVFPLTAHLSSEPLVTAPPVIMHPSWPSLTPRRARSLPQLGLTSELSSLALYSAGIGHMLTDAAERRVVLVAGLGNQAVPSFGLALATAFLQVSPEHVDIQSDRIVLRDAHDTDGQPRAFTIPMDRDGRMVVNYARTPDLLSQSHSILEIWEAIDRGERAQLQDWFGGKIVLILSDGATIPTTVDTPEAKRLPAIIQAQALNTILTERWIKPEPAVVTGVMALTLAGLAAWVLLSLGGWMAIPVVSLLFVGYAGLSYVLLASGNVLLPLFVPLTSLVVASGGTSLWTHWTASHRIGLLESKMQRIQQELAVVREELIRRESAVESLEEDLEAARAAVARSTGKEQELGRMAEGLRTQLSHAQTQEETSRLLLQKLEDELSGLRVASKLPTGLDNPEQDGLRQECEQLGIVTRDPFVLNVFRDLKKAARSNLSMLILGEAGTGKELFARAAHRLSGRAEHAFVAVNMAAISPDLFESELFGHVKGSFTGSLADRKGYFEQAHQGTLFLDEIGDLRVDHQGKLLRVLQEQSFYRVGDTKPTAVNVRIVAATNKDLQRGVIEGWFREDLFFRLKGVVLRLPALRERPQDIRLLAERFVRQAASQIGRSEIALSQEAAATLQAHVWKGNIRELQHCVQQAVTLAEGPRITRADLRLTSDAPTPGRAEVSSAQSIDASGDHAVLQALRQHEFDMQATARALGWDRSTVTQRLKGLSFRALVEAEGNRSAAAATLAGDASLVRPVELKLNEYYDHLMKTIQPFRSPDEAIAACKKRFKNLPDRHFQSVEALIQHYFEGR